MRPFTTLGRFCDDPHAPTGAPSLLSVTLATLPTLPIPLFSLASLPELGSSEAPSQHRLFVPVALGEDAPSEAVLQLFAGDVSRLFETDGACVEKLLALGRRLLLHGLRHGPRVLLPRLHQHLRRPADRGLPRRAGRCHSARVHRRLDAAAASDSNAQLTGRMR